MSKDPAFLFYSSDFITGTILMTNEQVGIYIKLLCIQHQHSGYIDKASFNAMTNGYDVVRSKFVEDNKGFYNTRLQEESNKRQKYSESRRNNRLKSTHVKHMWNISKTYVPHMENENENINETKKEPKTIHGEYKNVRITEKELSKIKEKFGDVKTQSLIKELDEGIELKGYKYKSHYLAMIKWAKNAKKDTRTKPVGLMSNNTIEERKQWSKEKRYDPKQGNLGDLITKGLKDIK